MIDTSQQIQINAMALDFAVKRPGAATDIKVLITDAQAIVAYLIPKTSTITVADFPPNIGPIAI